MKTKQAVKLAGSKAELARILGITRQSLTDWKKNVPELREHQLRRLRPDWFVEDNAAWLAAQRKGSPKAA